MSAEDRVYVASEFLSSTHGQLSCVSCHGGNNKTELTEEAKSIAHNVSEGFIAHPSSDAQKYCGSCHSSFTSNFQNSLHFTQEGYFERFSVRAGGADLRNDPNMKAGFDQDCGKCHATCGECHVIRPKSVNSGLNWAHQFRKTPDLNNNCTACHGSRVGEEYRGEHAGEKGWPSGIKADVHYNRGIRCEFCHDANEMHGDGMQYTYRYIENSNLVPKCQDCHSYTSLQPTDPSYNIYHETHSIGTGSKLGCQVCHSQPYKSCNGCHAKGTAQTGGITGSSYPSLKIGQNYLRSADRDYDYVLVRHIPVSPDTYMNWNGSYTLTTFEAEPTWKYTTPHNIQRWTTQTDTTGAAWCGESCHNDPDIKLRPTDVDSTYLQAELLANDPVFMP